MGGVFLPVYTTYMYVDDLVELYSYDLGFMGTCRSDDFLYIFLASIIKHNIDYLMFSLDVPCSCE